MQLPEAFVLQMKDLLGSEYEAYENCFDEERVYGLRTNDQKLDSSDFETISPWKTDRIPWTHNGFYYSGADRPSRHPFYFAGLYYLQEPSAMTPAEILDVTPGDRVLDLCAAPGGKSTQLGAALKGKGVLVSNDVSASRTKALLKNVEQFGIKNAVVMSELPQKLSGPFQGYFDKILIDAPCSGEGMFRKEPAVIKSWLEKGNSYFAGIQRGIVTEAVKMLKPGGKLLYSTCTFSPEENEQTIQYLLDTCPDMHIIPIPNRYEGFGPGLPERVENGSPDLVNCVRIWPQRMKGEGHFLALLQKDGEAVQTPPVLTGMDRSLQKDESFQEFLSTVDDPELSKRLVKHGDWVLQEPDQELPLQGLRVMRSGLLIGEVKKGRFEPGQAFAMSLNPEAYPNRAVYDAEDPILIKYLKGETIPVPEGDAAKKGFVLVCLRANGKEFPLGFAKGNGTMLKNRYLPGWRWQ